MFFTSISPAITFGAFLAQSTAGKMGLVEVLMSTFLCGSVFAVAAGQPLVIVGVTGPVCIFTITVYTISVEYEIPFLPFMG